MADVQEKTIQWYPGHMTKARRAMEEDVRKVDLLIEVLDSRCPLSSRNPDIDRIAKNKCRLIVLNKADLADESVTNEWIAYFRSKKIRCVSIDGRAKNTSKTIVSSATAVCSDLLQKRREKGILNAKMRVLVAGIPNVGKSTIINTLSGKTSAKTGNLPGVTKGNQWIKLGDQMDLLDTPGILWPKFEDPSVGEKLAFIGSINDDVLDLRSLALSLTRFMKENAPDAFLARYGLAEWPPVDSVIDTVALKKGWLLKGGLPDPDKASKNILTDYRTAKFGRISLERPVEDGK